MHFLSLLPLTLTAPLSSAHTPYGTTTVITRLQASLGHCRANADFGLHEGALTLDRQGPWTPTVALEAGAQVSAFWGRLYRAQNADTCAAVFKKAGVPPSP